MLSSPPPHPPSRPPHYFSDLFFSSCSFSFSFSNTGHIFFNWSIADTSVIEDFVLDVSSPRMFSTFGKNSLFQIFDQISLWYFELLATIFLLPGSNIFPYSCHGLMVVGLCFSVPQFTTWPFYLLWLKC